MKQYNLAALSIASIVVFAAVLVSIVQGQQLGVGTVWTNANPMRESVVGTTTMSATACLLDNSKESDESFSGLTYKSGDKVASIQTATGKYSVTSCIDFDNNLQENYQKIKVKYKHVQNICSDSCSGTGCGTNPGSFVFTSPDLQSWKFIKSLDYSPQGTTVELDTASSTYRYIRVCRGGGGNGRDNLALDSVSVERQIQATEWKTRFDKDVLKIPLVAATSSAALAWEKSKVILAAINMYEATGDTSYLRMARDRINVALSTAKDYPQIGYYGWVTNKYSKDGKEYPYLVHDGMVLHPIAKFIRLVSQDPTSLSEFSMDAANYKNLIETKFINNWNDSWFEDGDAGYYTNSPRFLYAQGDPSDFTDLSTMDIDWVPGQVTPTLSIATTTLSNNTCNLQNASVKDGQSAGLSYSSGQVLVALNTPTGKYSVTSCVDYDFQTLEQRDQMRVNYSTVSSTCGDACKDPKVCGTHPGAYLFVSPDSQNWKLAKSFLYASSTVETFVNTVNLGQFRYAKVCRAGGGHGRGNILVDSVEVATSTIDYNVIQKILPYNQIAPHGRMFLELAYATGNPEYKNKAVKIGNCFKRSLRVDGDRYLWNYWDLNTKCTYSPSGKMEDVSHANLEIGLAHDLYARNLVFSAEDMKKFAQTFKSAYHPDKQMMDTHIDKSRGACKADGTCPNTSVDSWIELSRIDNEVWTIATQIMKNSLNINRVNLLATANLEKYEPAKFWIVIHDVIKYLRSIL